MKVLVIDCADPIGHRTLAALAACGWAVPVGGRHRGRGTPPPGVAAITLDALDPAAVGAALEGVDAVVNCLGGEPATIAAGAQALFAAARARAPAGAPRIVHVSSMSVYGAATGTVDETAPLRGELGPYAAAKVAAEAHAAQAARCIVLRPGVDYGPEAELWSGRVGRWLLARRIGDLGAAGDGVCNLVHIDDVVAAVLASLRLLEATGAAGTAARCYNLAMAQPPTWNDYLVGYALALRAVPVRRVTSRRLRIETRWLAPPLKILEIAARRAGIDPGRLPAPIPPSLSGLLAQDLRLDARRAEAELGLRWKPLAAGLAEAAQWLRAQR